MTRRYRRRAEKFTALTLVPLIALAILGTSYGHWRETLTITGTITTGKRHTIIGSYKVLTPVGYDENRSITDELASNKESLHLTCSNVSNYWNIYVGLKIHNIGTFPATIETPLYRIKHNTQDIEGYFEIETYFYGPYETGRESGEVWADIKYGSDLPSSWGPGIETYPGQSAIIWTTLHFTSDDPDLILDPVPLEMVI